MAIVNHAKQEVNAKIVYCGQPGAGKATSLQYVYDRIKPSLRGELKAQPTAGSTLHFFDFSPFEQPVFGGYRLRFHVYTLHANVANPAAWKMTLKGADGLVFVMDGSPDALPAAQQSLAETCEFLNAYGVGLSDIPMVLQVNKADRSTLSASEQASLLGLECCNSCLTTATTGNGVLETLSLLSRDIITGIRERDNIPPPDEDIEADVDADEQTAGTRSDAEKEPVSRVEPEQAIFIDKRTNLQPGSGATDLEITLAETGLSVAGNSVQIPLDISLSGEFRRLVLTISIGSE
ncbi:MAG TPA: hypothetical protein VGJ93_08945 [Desulfuromonadaceae bacterium]|jgi:hypothetical protein